MPTNETVLSEIMPQKLAFGMFYQERIRSPVMADLRITSDGVSQVNLSSTGGWKFERALGLGLGGAMRFVNTSGPGIVSGAQPLMVMNETQLYPSPMESVQPGYDAMTGYLAKLRLVVAFDEAVLQAQQSDNILTDHVRKTIEGTELNFALHKLSKLFTPSATTRHICSTTSTTVVDANNISFIPSEGNEVLFREGQMVQFYDVPSAGLVSHRHTPDGSDDASVRIMVMAVDPTSRRVYVKDIDGLGRLQITGNLTADGDIVVHQGELSGGGAVGVGGTAVAYGPYGFVDWLVNTGNILGVSTSTFQRLKSFIKANLAGPWTEDEADLIFTWFNRWHEHKIDRLYTTPGVIVAHRRTFAGLYRADRTNQAPKMVGGHRGVTYVHDGREVTYLSDPHMRSGTLIGQYVGNGNIEMMVPPLDPTKSGGPSPFGSMVRFKEWGAGAYKSIFHPVAAFSGSAGAAQMSTLMEAVASVEYQMWPQVLPGILILGATEVNWAA